MFSQKVSSIGFALIAVLLWGTAGTAQSFIEDDLSPLWVGALRLLLASVVFHGFYFYRKICDHENNETSVASQSYWIYITIAGCCIGLFNLAFFTGVSKTGVAIGSVSAIGSSPIWAGLIQFLIFRKKPEPIWLIGTLCAIVGGGLMVLSQASNWHVDFLGLLISLSAGFFYALYTITSKRLVSTASPVQITTHTFTIATIIALLAAFVFADPLCISLQSLAVIVYLAVFTTCVGYLLYTRALKYLSAASGVALTLFEPMTAFILAIIVVGEPVNISAVIGMGLICVGLAFALISELKAKKK